MTPRRALLVLHESSGGHGESMQPIAGFCPRAGLRTSNEPLPETKMSCLLFPL